MILKRDGIRNVLTGATLLGTGGGGSLEEALDLTASVDNLNIVKTEELQKESNVFSAFTVGTLNDKISKEAIVKAKELFFSECGNEFDGIIPVEAGPGSIGESIYLSSQLGIPLVDGDLVGYRAAPEIFLETITLKGLERAPIVSVNNRLEAVFIKVDPGCKEIEKFLREFAVKSCGIAFVCGYPLKLGDIADCAGFGSISFCQKIGELLSAGKFLQSASKLGFSIIGEGIVNSVSLKDNNGFLSGSFMIENKNAVFEIKIKNENIVCNKGSKTIATSPDLICLYDKQKNIGVYNRELKNGTEVCILGLQAMPIWRTKAGIKLFSPKNLGFTEEYVDFKEAINNIE